MSPIPSLPSLNRFGLWVIHPSVETISPVILQPNKLRAPHSKMRRNVLLKAFNFLAVIYIRRPRPIAKA